MAHAAGGKITGNHTTLTDLSKLIVHFLVGISEVTKISIGVVSNNGGKKSNSTWVVKIIDETNCVLVRSMQSNTVSEIRFYTTNRQETKLALARFIRDSGWGLRFGNAIER